MTSQIERPSQNYVNGLDIGRLIEDREIVYSNLCIALYYRELDLSKEVEDFIDGVFAGLMEENN